MLPPKNGAINICLENIARFLWRQQDSTCISARWAEIEVATSVCTGGRKCPPDTSISIVRVLCYNAYTNKKTHPNGWAFLLVETTGLEPVTSCV